MKHFIPAPNWRPLTRRDLIHFFRQLSTLIASGISLIKGLEILHQTNNKTKFRQLIQTLMSDLENGQSFYRCLEKHSSYFDPFCCQLICIGEHTGTLEKMLKRITLYKEKEQTLQSQLKQALFYPALIFIFTLSTSLILLLLVVPQFATLFQHFPDKIPAPTQFIIHLSFMLQKNGPSLGLFIAVILFAVIQARQTLKLGPRFQTLIFKLPLIQDLLLKLTLVRFSRYLALMLTAAAPLSEALLILSPLFKFEKFRLSILKQHAHIQTGKRFYSSLALDPLFPALLVQMVRTGEESGSLDLMLGQFAEIMEVELEQKLIYWRLLLEPLIIAILGVLIGGVVIAMYLPIFRLGAAI